MKNATKRVLVTGIGGIGGVNFVRSLRLAESQVSGAKFFIAGTDFNPFYLHFADVDFRQRSPRHTDPAFLPLLISLIKEYDLDFVHPHPSVEAKLVSEKVNELPDRVRTFLPKPGSISPDKLEIHRLLVGKSSISVARTWHLRTMGEIDEAFRNVAIDNSAWVRAVSGAGGRLGLRVKSPEEVKLWIQLNISQGRAKLGDFLLHEYLPGKDLAFDSLWHRGQMLKFYSRERLEYPFKHISLSGITGTPSVARIIHDRGVTDLGRSAILALDPEPHGFFSVDMKEDKNGKLVVTEVDGKWHTTAPLWGYAFAKAFEKPEYNLAYDYVRVGIEGNIDPYRDVCDSDFFPEDTYLIRQMDSGVILKQGTKDAQTWRVL